MHRLPQAKDTLLGLAGLADTTDCLLAYLCLRTDALHHELGVGLQLLFCRVSSQSDLLKPTSSCPQPLLSSTCRPGDWMGRDRVEKVL